MKHRIFLACFLGMIAAGSVMNAAAQSTANAYVQANLVSDISKGAAHIDRNLVNPWGIAFFPGQPLFLADNKRGVVRVYDADGNDELPVGFAILPPAGSKARPTPSGIVANPTQSFVVDSFPSQYVIAAQDGTISDWASENGDLPQFAVQTIDNSARGAVYTGLAILTPACCAPFLAVANFNSGDIETYTGFFDLLAPPGSFTDPMLPAGYAPFNMQIVGNQVFVTYAMQMRRSTIRSWELATGSSASLTSTAPS